MNADRTPSSRVVKVQPRNMRGQYKGRKDINHHPSSNEGGDNTARALGWRVAIRPEECAAWGVPFVREHESGRGIAVFDGVTPGGCRASIKEATRSNWLAATSVVLTTPTEASIATYGAAIMKGCPVVVVHRPGDYLDLDHLRYKVIDGGAILAAAGGDLANVPDRTDAGHPGRGGSGAIWGKWVMRKCALTGREHGPYWEVSISTRFYAWKEGTIEDIEREVAAILG